MSKNADRGRVQFINDDLACSRCGQCCSYLIFPFNCKSADCNEYFFTHGAEMVGMHGMKIFSPCQHLCFADVDGKIEYSCNIYEKRPKWCHLHDPSTKNIRMYKFPECTEK